MKILLVIVVALSWFSANSQKKKVAGIEFFPAQQYRKVVDTTFEYEINEPYSIYNPPKYPIPDSLGGTKMNGTIEFYSYINDNGAIDSITVTQILLYRKEKVFINTTNNRGLENTPLYIDYFKKLITTLPYKRNKQESNQITHKTFGVISF